MEQNYDDMIKKSTKNSMILFVGQILINLIGAISNILVARFLGPTDFGLVSIALVPITLSLLLINNGVRRSFITYIADYNFNNNKNKIKNLVFSGYILNLSLGILISSVVYLTAHFWANNVIRTPEIEPLVKILSIIVFAQALQNTSNGVFEGFERMELRIVVAMVFSLLKSVMAPLLVFYGYGVVGAAIGNTTPYLLAGILAIIIALNILKKYPSDNTLDLKKNLQIITVYAFPLFMSGLLTGGLSQIFNFILPLYASTSNIGNYNAAIVFATLMSFITLPINIATFPLLSKINVNDTIIKSVYQNIVKYESFILYPIASLIIAISDQLVLFVYGTEYSLCSLFLRVSMLSFFLKGLGSDAASNLLNSQKETKATFRGTLVYTLLGIPLGWYLIPKFGVLGLQATLIMANTFGLLYIVIWIKNNYLFSIDWSSFYRISSSTVVSYIICIFTIKMLNFGPLLEIAISSIIFFISYFSLTVVTGIFNKNEIKDIQNYLPRNILTNNLFKKLLIIIKD